MMQLFERGNLDEIQQAAIKGPEKIVQMIDPDSPTQVAEFMRILREVPAQAKKSGSKKSREQGERAARMVQQAWFSDNVLDGGIDGLPDRLAKLDAKPEFVKAFLGDPEYQNVLTNTRAMAQAWKDDVARVAAEEAAAETASKTGVEAAQERARQAGFHAQDTGEASVKAARGTLTKEQAAVEAAREKAAASVKGVERQNRALHADQARRVREARVSGQQELQDLRTAKRQDKAPTPEEIAFEDSSISPANLHRSKGGFYTTVRRVLTALVGMHALGPAGAALVFAEKGATHATEKDILKYVVHSPALTRFIVNNFAASQKPNWLASQAGRSAVAAVRKQLEAEQRARQPQGEGKP
jgi:hypothetical protein